jgi:hypothetical protein
MLAITEATAQQMLLLFPFIKRQAISLIAPNMLAICLAFVNWAISIPAS